MENICLTIQENYGLNLTFVEKVTKGFLSENYILKDDTHKYFLKKYRYDSEKRIEEIHKVKKYFADTGVPVILLISCRSGESFFLYNNAYYALFPFVYGHQYERGKLSDDMVSSLGEMLGKIHQSGKGARIPLEKNFDAKSIHSEKTLSKMASIVKCIQSKKSLDHFDDIALLNIELKRKLIIVNTLSEQDIYLLSDHLIHGDYLDSNVFFDTQGHVSQVFDFEKSMYAPRVFELLRASFYSLLSDVPNERDLESIRIFLKAYKKVYQVPEEEMIKGFHLFYVKSIHGLWVEEEHYIKNNTRVDHFIFSDYGRNLYLAEHFEEVKNILLS